MKRKSTGTVCRWLVIAAFGMMALAVRGVVREELRLEGDHGMLSAVLERPDDATNFPVVIVMHGYSGNKDARLLREISGRINAVGIGTMRFDFNGHGASEGRFEDMTVPNEVEDAKKVLAYLGSRSDVREIALVGHSQGGVVASLVAGELGAEKIKAIALLAPATILKEHARSGYLFGVRYDPVNPPEFVEAFGRRLGRAYVLSAQKLPIYETVARFSGPVMVVHGMDDRIVPFSCAEKYRYVLPQTRLVPLKGHNHGFTRDIPAVAAIVADFLAAAMH